MKKLLLSISLTMIAVTSFGQTQWNLDFDSPLYLDRIVRDTITNPNCSWQIGQPAKTVFTSAHSIPNVIVTDTLNAVPSNDTSIFYLKHVRSGSPMAFFILHFWYQMDGDSTDFGMVEISPDAGNNWVNVLTQDTTFLMSWYMPKPTLTGSTNGWTSFDLGLENWASGFGIFPIAMTADTIIFRFTYITDSGSTPHDGWMIDNFYLEDWFEGIEENQANLISISPNPFSDNITITSKANEHLEITLYDLTSRKLLQQSFRNTTTINTSQLARGIYLYEVRNKPV